jgi:membrane protease YdiL (CAAX protease family)
MVVIGSAGILTPGRVRWLRALLWLAALTVMIVVVYNAVAKASLWLMTLAAGSAIASGAAQPAPYRLLAAVTGSIALVAAYGLAVRLGERRRVPELGLQKAPVDMVLGATLGAALMIVIVGTLWVFGWVAIHAATISGVALAARDSIRSGVLEELVLRLVIFRLLWRAVGVWPAIAGAALLFGVLHLANPDSSLFAAACLIAGEGIGIGLYLLTGRIWAPIGMHAAWNFTQGWIFGAVVSGTSEISGGPLSLRPAANVSQMLSGGGFGPEASWAALIISFAASAVLLAAAWRGGCFKAADA